METQREEVSRVRELQEELSKLASLKEHAGYQYLMEIAEAQVKGRMDQMILTPLEGMDQVLRQEYAKGEVAGIRLFTNIVEIRLTDLQEEIEDLVPREENEDEHASD